MNLARSLGSVGGLTLVSRVLALVRDTLQASYVGASFASDAFFVAFRLPNMFRALFAEGAFSAAFIPMFNRKVGEADDVSAGLRFLNICGNILFFNTFSTAGSRKKQVTLIRRSRYNRSASAGLALRKRL